MSIKLLLLLHTILLFNISSVLSHAFSLMWVSAIKLNSLRHFIKPVQCIRCRSFSSLPQLPVSSHFQYISSDSEEGEDSSSHSQYIWSGSEEEDSSECNSTSEVVNKLDSFRKDPGAALTFFELLKARGFRHNVHTYAAIVRILCYCGRQKKLESLLRELVQKMNDLNFEVIDLFEALSKEGSNVFYRVSDAMVKAYCSERMFDQALNVLFQTDRPGFVWSKFTCNFFMNQLLKCGEVDMVLVLYEEMKSVGFSLNQFTYDIVIKALCKLADRKSVV